MNRPWMKVCGITRTEDAQVAVECGARALGFILHPESPRYVEPEAARDIIHGLHPRVGKVAVTVDASPEFIWDLKLNYGFTAVQAHGNESPEDCAHYPLPVVKAVRCRPELELYDFSPFAEFPILLDGYRPGMHGGTGVVADWELALRLKEAGHRVLLAGGLGPHNVLEAVETVEPDALDFNSMVEVSPGIKDHDKLRVIGEALDTLEEAKRESWPW